MTNFSFIFKIFKISPIYAHTFKILMLIILPNIILENYNEIITPNYNIIMIYNNF